jgi:subtilisin family serine protease
MADVHGTAVAGVLSARPNNAIGIAGIAPDAEVAALRACWPDAPDAVASHCNSFTLALALNEAIRLHSRIINLSLTGPEDPLVAQLIETALAQDAIVIAALPGKEQPGGFPARLPGVIAVGSEDGVKLAQIVAPGQDILTTVPHGAYDFLSGSSFATPHIAGVVALMLELRPGLTAAEVRQILLAAPQQPAGGSMDVAALLEHLDARK